MKTMHLSFRKNIVLFLSFCIIVTQGQINGNSNQSSTANIGPSFFLYDHPQYPRDCEEVRLQCSAADSSGVYVIKPDGYADAFEVYCDINIDGGGWTVVQRRTEGSIDFLRGWEDYKEGFGFLWNEFWIGFEKLSFLTNQKNYNIRISMEDATGSSSYIQYEVFRTSDDKGDFRITRLGEYSGTAIIPESAHGACPPFMEYGNCTCQKTCQDPEGLMCQTACSDGEGCICEDGFLKRGEECVLPEKCGCFVEGGFIQNDQWYINVNCSSICQCHSNVLSCDDYRCSADATCEERGGVRQCYCNNGYTGDGRYCLERATDCADIYKAGFTDSGVYSIKPSNWPGSPFEVYCNMSQSEGWTVFQRRIDGSQDFYLGWNMYKYGFGSSNRELWLGNNKLYYMTNSKNYQLRIDLVDRDGNQYHIRYVLFRISDENNDYTLVELGRSYGNTGSDSLTWHRNKPFSTYDRDNDGWNNYNCAQRHRAGWWFGERGTYTTGACETREDYCGLWPFGGDSCGWCGLSNLNGDYGSPVHGTNIHWYRLSGFDCNIVFSEMKLIRPY